MAPGISISATLCLTLFACMNVHAVKFYATRDFYDTSCATLHYKLHGFMGFINQVTLDSIRPSKGVVGRATNNSNGETLVKLYQAILWSHKSSIVTIYD